MRDFIDYLQEAFITASGGNTYDNSVKTHTNPTPVPNLTLNISLTRAAVLQPRPHIPIPAALSHANRQQDNPLFLRTAQVRHLVQHRHKGRLGLVPLLDPAHRRHHQLGPHPLPDLLRSYRSLSTSAARHAVGHGLVYGRLYLPQSRLEALLATRVTREVNLTIRAVSQETLRHGGTALALASWDDPAGRFGIETLASSTAACWACGGCGTRPTRRRTPSVRTCPQGRQRHS